MLFPRKSVNSPAPSVQLSSVIIWRARDFFESYSSRDFPKLLDLFVVKGEVARNPDTFHLAFPLIARALLAISI